jgi:hypothetical protein
MTSKKSLLLAAALAAVLAAGGVAEAKNSDRFRSRADLQETGAVDVRGAQIRVERERLGNERVVVRVSGAPAGELTVLVADADGVPQPVATMTPHGRSGRATWAVRTSRGDALPFGVADIADLSGRALEVRTADGTAILTGVLPTVAKASGMPRNLKSMKIGLAVDGSVAGAGVEARIEVRRRHGADELRVKVEGAAAGLALEAWIIQADGTSAKLGDLVAEGADDSAHQGTGTEYELRLTSSATLPFGAATLADLAGLAVEVRDAADGSVVASGFLPDTSAPAAHGGHGADDAAGDDHGSGGHGADDAAGDDHGAGGQGADDPAGDVHGGQGGHRGGDGPNHG